MKIARICMLFFFVAIITQGGHATAATGKPADKGTSSSATAPPEKGPLLRVRSSTESFVTSRQGRQYRILVSAPKGAEPIGGFPVLYILDADAWFGTAVEIAKMREYEKLAPAVIVGVASPKHFFFGQADTVRPFARRNFCTACTFHGTG